MTSCLVKRMNEPIAPPRTFLTDDLQAMIDVAVKAPHRPRGPRTASAPARRKSARDGRADTESRRRHEILTVQRSMPKRPPFVGRLWDSSDVAATLHVAAEPEPRAPSSARTRPSSARAPSGATSWRALAGDARPASARARMTSTSLLFEQPRPPPTATPRSPAATSLAHLAGEHADEIQSAKTSARRTAPATRYRAAQHGCPQCGWQPSHSGLNAMTESPRAAHSDRAAHPRGHQSPVIHAVVAPGKLWVGGRVIVRDESATAVVMAIDPDKGDVTAFRASHTPCCAWRRRSACRCGSASTMAKRWSSSRRSRRRT